MKRPVLRYHGGKFRIAEWLLPLFPSHTCYVEPFGGAAGVLLQKPRSYGEVYNDLDGDVVNFFRVLRDPEMRARLVQACIFTPYAREEFDMAWEPCEEPVERARRIAVRATMGFGSAGATKGTTGFRIDVKREYGAAQQLWALYPDSLSKAGQRLHGVLIENRSAAELFPLYDGPDTLFFIDPPYPHSTRVRSFQGGSLKYYRYEMSDDDHRALLDQLIRLRGMVVVCSYPNEIYEDVLRSWRRVEYTARIAAGRGGATRTEVAWCNPQCAARQAQVPLFSEVPA